MHTYEYTVWDLTTNAPRGEVYESEHAAWEAWRYESKYGLFAGEHEFKVVWRKVGPPEWKDL